MYQALSARLLQQVSCWPSWANIYLIYIIRLVPLCGASLFFVLYCDECYSVTCVMCRLLAVYVYILSPICNYVLTN